MTKSLDSERKELLRQINHLTDRPLFYLSFVWLGLTIYELVNTNQNSALENISYVIWGLFVVDFIIEITIAPNNKKYIKENWLVALSLLLPALRLLRILKFARYLRAIRSIRSISLIKIIASLNRNISIVRTHAQHFGLRYVFLISSIVIAIGSVGIINFEHVPASQNHLTGMDNYGDAIWWP